MIFLGAKNQMLTVKRSHESFYLTTCFALQLLFISYQLGQLHNSVACSPADSHQYSHNNHHQHHHHHQQQQQQQQHQNHNNNHHHHHHKHSYARQILDEPLGGDHEIPHHNSRLPRRRLHSRAVYLAYDQSRINSSESLASSWFYQQDQPAILDQCCACDEAKYELVFEGLWSKYTHPEDFPENYWLAFFSDIIGASHSNDFRMWSQDSLASDGVRELAETGATKKLESELKQVSSKTRTIIKARELRYPTLNSKTSAVFRTDKHHHLVSILSKLGPSPDWMVGVSSLELCQMDCTWAAQRIVNLYLWDAGTDSGSSFMASDSPTRPQERIRPYRRASPGGGGGGSQVSANPTRLMDQQLQQNSDSNGQGDTVRYERNQRLDQLTGELLPIADETAQSNQQTANTAAPAMQDQMRPFARLTVTRQRIYEKSCSASMAEPAVVTPSRTNSYNLIAQQQQQQPQQHLNHLQPSLSADTLIEPVRPSYSDCRYTDWSDWSSCSSTCGKGIRTRTRSFYDDQAHLAAGCSQADLIEKEICLADCLGNASCVTHDWSEWSKCSVSCGQGYRRRTRSPIGPLKPACTSIELAEVEQCTGSCGQGSDLESDQPAPSHCAVTEWSQWSECSVACGKGTKIRTRQFTRREDLENCANVKLLQKQSCTGRPELCKQVASKGNQVYGSQSGNHLHQQQQNQKQINFDLPVIDCKLSNWSPWSTCSALCGHGKRTRSRYIIQMPQNGGKPCDKKLSRTQRCRNLPPCPLDSSNNQGGGAGRNHKTTSQHHRTAVHSFGQHRTTTSSTTPGMMDDEDDSKFSRLLKADMGHLQLPGWAPTETYQLGGTITSTEMELIGSSSFQIRNGFAFPFENDPRNRREFLSD